MAGGHSAAVAQIEGVAEDDGDLGTGAGAANPLAMNAALVVRSLRDRRPIVGSRVRRGALVWMVSMARFWGIGEEQGRCWGFPESRKQRAGGHACCPALPPPPLHRHRHRRRRGGAAAAATSKVFLSRGDFGAHGSEPGEITEGDLTDVVAGCRRDVAARAAVGIEPDARKDRWHRWGRAANRSPGSWKVRPRNR